MNTTGGMPREAVQILQPIAACRQKGKVWRDSRPTVTSCPNQHASALPRENTSGDKKYASEADEGDREEKRRGGENLRNLQKGRDV